MMDLEGLVNARWESQLREHHSSIRDESMASVVEVWRDGGLVIAAFPPDRDTLVDTLMFVTGFGPDAVLAMFEAKFRAVGEDEEAPTSPEDDPLSDEAVVLTATLPDGSCHMVIHPFHRDSMGNAWYRDPIVMSGAEIDGDFIRTLRESFPGGMAYRREIVTAAPSFGIDAHEAAIRADCALAKMLAHHDVPLLMGATNEEDAEIIRDSMENGPSPDDLMGPNPEMN